MVEGDGCVEDLRVGPFVDDGEGVQAVFPEGGEVVDGVAVEVGVVLDSEVQLVTVESRSFGR